jgi:hypothetical protein
LLHVAKRIAKTITQPADAFGQLADGAVAGGSADVKVGAFTYPCLFSFGILHGAVTV